MLNLIHLITGLILVVAHGVFLGRGLWMRSRGGKPGLLDKTARFLSQAGLPLTVLIGVVALSSGEKQYSQTIPLILHIILGLLPFFVIIAFAPLLSLKRKIPWLLPTINLLLFTFAAVLGLCLVR